MRVIHGSSRSQVRRWVIVGLFAAAVLMAAVVANARKAPGTGYFQQIESGINHAALPCDSHHMCGVGMNSLLGHFAVTVVLVETNSGIIEYQFPGPGGDAIYGTWAVKETQTPGLSQVNVRFTRGTGRFENKAYGSATGTLRSGAPSLGVLQYTATLQGNLYAVPTGNTQ